MKKTKVLSILLLIIFIVSIGVSDVTAHSVELDPEKLITFPSFIYGGKGSISIKKSETGYTLYYQAVELANDKYNEIKGIKENGETALATIKEVMNKLNAECKNLKTVYEDARDAYQNKIDSGAVEEEMQAEKSAYEAARTNYQNKVNEYNAKVEEYNAKVNEINNKVKELTPAYVESNWIKTEDRSFNIDLTKFSGEKAFVVWAKLVRANGTISYDEIIYTMSGTKEDEISVKSVSLDKTELALTEGKEYTLVATINPVNANNKTVIWTSDNENVAKVEYGKVIAISEGTATITATTSDGGFTATCEVTVTKNIETPPTTDEDKEENKPEDTKPEGENKPEENKPENTKPEDSNPEQDTTIAPDKIPQTGEVSYKIILAILGLSIIGIFMYKKVKYLNFK